MIKWTNDEIFISISNKAIKRKKEKMYARIIKTNYNSIVLLFPQ